MLSTTLSGNYGFPLCISGITSQQLTLSKEMADHEKRRKVMKRRRRSEVKDECRISHGEESSERVQEMRDNEDVRDLVALLQLDLVSCSFSSHAAKAA